MSRILILIYAILSYAAFLAVFVWFAAFLLDLGSIRTAGPATPWPQAAAIDVGLISLFGLAHSVMARPAFKRRWTRIVPAAAERATYVLQSSALLGLIMLCWRPIPVTVWQAEGLLAAALLGLFLAGLGLVVLATFALDHFEFTGLRQAWDNLRGRETPAPAFRTPLPYRIVRHPLQLGLVLAMVAAPRMTGGGLLFAAVMLAYILIGLRFEERALLRRFGKDYAAYRNRVPMLFPRLPWIARPPLKRHRLGAARPARRPLAHGKDRIWK